ncbi:Oidioi.mRNA.OKI2018_I69.chr1.g745.t1.cds [Oikopleura dioica]|uniref:Oidioi.mRNA.OKI2018_I69.chr1.g745.t1.cds n=1 Tax=Oikopleura dioica TaxID=34765 RepID=A0ABN7SPM7_OIKDI|nr:Oidioi.mRNA.OKI2018_I69.chr1.g745.t1.cds [Oikopleura dioica]
MKIFSILQFALALAGKARNNKELIADASGKLTKLNQRTQKIYVDYLADWPRADNYIHKLHKMQKALAEFLEKCGYDPISITKFEEDWNVDLNGDNIIGKGRRRRRRRDEDYDSTSGSGDEGFREAVEVLSDYWDDFFDESESVRRNLGSDFDFLFGNDVGGIQRSFAEHAGNKIKKLFNGYKKFTAVYLSKCKKIENVSQRVDNTVKRLNGAVRRYEDWLTEEAIKKEKKQKEAATQAKKKAKKSKKSIKRQLKLSNF